MNSNVDIMTASILPISSSLATKHSVKEILTPTFNNTLQTAPFANPQEFKKIKKFKSSHSIKFSLELLLPYEKLHRISQPENHLEFRSNGHLE